MEVNDKIEWIVSQIRELNEKYFNVSIVYSNELKKNKLMDELFGRLKEEYDEAHLIQKVWQAKSLWKFKNCLVVIDHLPITKFRSAAIQMDFDGIMAMYKQKELSVITFRKKGIHNRIRRL